MNAGSETRAVVVTRAEAADGPLSRALTSLGLRVLLWPAVRVSRAEPAALAAALRAIGRFDWIVFATSSGGTQAGLEVGKRLFGYQRLRLLGVSADDPADSIKQSVRQAMEPMLWRLGLPEQIDPRDLAVDDRFIGDGYGIPSPESTAASRLFADLEGILIDPVYSSKAAAGLIAYCREGAFRESDRVLFWHTGGLMTLL
jgi:D-cysteine desulfhydrase